MRTLPLRRSQLVGSNGPGSLVVSPEGETAIVGALDYWFIDSSGNKSQAISEFEIYEPRLKGFLGINKLYTPPDYRDEYEDIPNNRLAIPLLRFPRWHYCPFCHTMQKLNYTIPSSRQYCKECDTHRYLKQVPFVMICSKGHISDFPWREWVHENDETACTGSLKLITTGGSTLDSWIVKCSCGKTRSLKGITSNNTEKKGSTVLSERLNKHNKEFKCTGHKAWCGDVFETCHENPVAILRNSINVYMPVKISVISLPGEKNTNVDKLLELLNRNIAIKSLIDSTEDFKNKVDVLYNISKSQFKVSIEDCEKAILYLNEAIVENGSTIETASPMMLRNKEFEKLQFNCEEDYLKVYEEWDNCYKDDRTLAGPFASYIRKVNRVTKLRETIALAGFKRLSKTEPDGQYTFTVNYDDLYHTKISNKDKWLPAYSVYGEGIFIQFDLEKIKQWEADTDVRNYFENYKIRVENVKHQLPEIIEYPRNIMMHTLAHLLIEEIANTSGYNMASIRERLYINENQASVLIYTSAGDIEGTFGGLVRLGRKDKFFNLLDKAVANSQWCSSDPVCSELGSNQGQGLYGVNGAACYNCCHLPETSCEIGNMYLDRTLISHSEIGFFKDIFK